MAHQLTLGPVLTAARDGYLARVERHVGDHAQEYAQLAERITPDLADWRHVHERLTFAILSAHATFDAAVQALRLVQAGEIPTVGMVPAKVEYIRALGTGDAVLTHRRQSGESHQAHRGRLTRLAGLGLCKATFAACLLDPVYADVACVDTHLQRAYLGGRGGSVPRSEYLEVETQLRALGRRHGISTFVAQWCAWDFIRGTRTDHDIWSK